MVFRSITTTALSKLEKCRIYAHRLRMYSGMSITRPSNGDIRPRIRPLPPVMQPPPPFMRPPSLMLPPFLGSTPGELGTTLMQDSKTLNPIFMLVQLLQGGSRNYSAVAMHNNSFKPLQSATFYSWLLFWAQLKERELVTYHLWNPWTDEFKTLAPFEVEPHLPNWHHLDHMLWGVGFDSASQDHKVVRGTRIDYYDTNEHNEDDPYFSPTTDWSEFEAEVLSLKTGVWKRIPFPHEPMFRVYHGRSIHINGFAYWIVRYNRFVIIPFDMDKDEFPAALIPMPETDKYLSCGNTVLAEYHGSLAVIVHDYCFDLNKVQFAAEMNHPFGFEIWVWNDGSWSKVSTCHVPVAEGITKVMGLFNNDKVLLINSKGELLLYDHVTSDLRNLGFSHDQISMVNIYPYYAKST
ncbi:F-box family protein [Striga asiatica]|uniref:F-box family protein n=1 Tax=Striga asiatica TaxID=4170 RepID=A0A5A7P9E0_STRAF|nr:F-box family protein [Striga asiatica]